MTVNSFFLPVEEMPGDGGHMSDLILGGILIITLIGFPARET